MKTMIYGYCRVSTRKQSIERQIRNIIDLYPNAFIIKEAYTGTKIEGRIEFQRLITLIKSDIAKGNKVILVFDSVSRMSRNAEEGFALYNELCSIGVDMVFIKEPHINTETYREALDRHITIKVDSGDDATDEFILSMNDALNRYMMRLVERQIQLAFQRSEAEVNDIKTRTKEGLKTVIINGGKIGIEKGTKLTTKKSIIAKEQIMKYSRDFNGTLNDKETIKLIDIAPNTFYKYKRELRQSA